MSRTGKSRFLLAPASSAAAVLLLVLLGGAQCPTSVEEGCRAEPEEPLVAFFSDTPSSEPTTSFSGRFIEATPPNEYGIRRLAFLDDSARRRELTLRAPLSQLPLEAGHSYDIRLDHRSGFPDLTGLWIRDAEGLAFAGASDLGLGSGAIVLPEGIPGFQLELVSSSCPSRLSDSCYREIRNARLRVRHGNLSVTLYQGESATLGDYQVRCLIAQEVTYREGCADAGLHAISYVILRQPTS